MDILCIGLLVADIIVKPVERIESSACTERVDMLKLSNGGDCMNAALVLSKLGIDVAIAGRIGDDLFGRYLLNVLEANGIRSEGVIVSSQDSTAGCIVLVNSSGERTFLYYGGANDHLEYADIDLALVDAVRLVHIGGAMLLPALDGMGMSSLLETAKLKGKLTSMDVSCASKEKAAEAIKPCLKFLDYFIPSFSEAEIITGEHLPGQMADFLLNEGVRVVVIKLGEKGCYVKEKGSEGFIVDAYRMEVLDTTGAGDSFTAGFLTGVLKGWDLHECARFACAVSTFCIRQIGSTVGAPCFEDVISFMEGNSVK